VNHNRPSGPKQFTGVAIAQHHPAVTHDHRALGKPETGREQRDFHEADDLRRTTFPEVKHRNTCGDSSGHDGTARTPQITPIRVAFFYHKEGAAHYRESRATYR
jgi:hypothetical protein